MREASKGTNTTTAFRISHWVVKKASSIPESGWRPPECAAWWVKSLVRKQLESIKIFNIRLWADSTAGLDITPQVNHSPKLPHSSYAFVFFVSGLLHIAYPGKEANTYWRSLRRSRQIWCGLLRAICCSNATHVCKYVHLLIFINLWFVQRAGVFLPQRVQDPANKVWFLPLRNIISTPISTMQPFPDPGLVSPGTTRT